MPVELLHTDADRGPLAYLFVIRTQAAVCVPVEWNAARVTELCESTQLRTVQCVPCISRTTRNQVHITAARLLRRLLGYVS